MNTSKVTRALRKSSLPEYKVLEKNRKGLPVREQDGWQLEKREDGIVVKHSVLNAWWLVMPEFTHPERTTENYAKYIVWLDEVVDVLTSAGLAVEVVYGQHKFGRFNQHLAQFIKHLKVTQPSLKEATK
jgi:hypothetical protein